MQSTELTTLAVLEKGKRLLSNEALLSSFILPVGRAATENWKPDSPALKLLTEVPSRRAFYNDENALCPIQ